MKSEARRRSERKYRQSERYKAYAREYQKRYAAKRRASEATYRRDYSRWYAELRRQYPGGVKSIPKENRQRVVDAIKRSVLPRQLDFVGPKLPKRHLNRLREAELRVFVMRYKAERGCADCGERDPIVLDLDHDDRTQKRKAVSEMIKRYSKVASLLREMEKCTVRCSNCHRRRTAKQLGYFSVAAYSYLPVHEYQQCGTSEDLLQAVFDTALPDPALPPDGLIDFSDLHDPPATLQPATTNARVPDLFASS